MPTGPKSKNKNIKELKSTLDFGAAISTKRKTVTN